MPTFEYAATKRAIPAKNAQELTESNAIKLVANK
jgi:hypothetical protein